MLSCTFFGHRDCADHIKPLLQKQIELCIIEQKVEIFYVGNQGKFDAMVIHLLEKMKEKYPHIVYRVVLAYRPVRENKDICPEAADVTVLPDGIERVPPRYAISFRNRWMIDKSDFVIAYVTRTYGGAFRFTERAKRQGKTVIHLAEK